MGRMQKRSQEGGCLKFGFFLFLFAFAKKHSIKSIGKDINSMKSDVNDVKKILNQIWKSKGCPIDWQYFSNTTKCYKRFEIDEVVLLNPGWQGAQEFCVQQGGILAVIKDIETNNFVTSVSEGSRSWIGAFRIGPLPFQNDQFMWLDGSSMIFDNWSPDNPNNDLNNEFCVELNYPSFNSGLWNDNTCTVDTVTSFVCQIDSSI